MIKNITNKRLNKLKHRAFYGDPSAQFDLATVFEFVKHDSKQAFHWYLASAKQGVADAMYSLGACYGDGYGVRVNNTFAAKWFRKAAMAGSLRGQYAYGKSLLYGIGVRKNSKQSEIWLSKAAQSSHADAIAELGNLYYHSTSKIRNISTAIRFYERAAELGSVEAAYNLAFCYQEGIGVKCNLDRAFSLFMQSVSTEPDSANQIGYYYYYGLGRKVDQKKAFIWYQKGSRSGSANAIYNLSLCYLYGTGCRKNSRLAYLCLSRAAKLGNRQAIAKLRRM